MVKSIIKETFIMILLFIAILLILGILFYDYIPANRVVPVKEAYETPENVKTEINEQITEIEKTIISYEVTESDLKVYKQNDSYKPGKQDPFSEAVIRTEGNTTDNTNSTGNSKTNTNSTGTFFDDDGGLK